MHTTEQILRAAAAWSWLPRGGEVDKTHLRLVRYPERLGGGVRASQVRSGGGAADVIAYAIDRGRAWGASGITFWTNPSDTPDLEPELRRRGADHVDTVAVFACPLDRASVDELTRTVPAGVSVEVVETLAQVREVDAVNVPIWDQSPLDEDGLCAELEEVRTALDAGVGLQVLGRLHGRAVSVAGRTFVDGFTRLWGAGTLADARGRGVYRAVLAERLRLGEERGTTTALVKGRLSTSAPILSRAGFRHYGDERAYRLDLDEGEA